MKIDNAIIMAAGTSSRFAPLSYEKPKALIKVKGEVLIERQIRQLQCAGVSEIYVVTGYKAEQFEYLQEQFGVKLIHNPDYLIRNNHASIWCARGILKNSYICSADNYFSINPFEKEVNEAYYAAVYSKGDTNEWCIQEDEEGFISGVHIGGRQAWYMLGHTFWSEEFSKRFLRILEQEYYCPQTVDKLWEDIFIEHLDELKMKVRKYDKNSIFEFDTLNELREFDINYVTDTHSEILKRIAAELRVTEADIRDVISFKQDNNSAAGFTFKCIGTQYKYVYEGGMLEMESN